MRRRISVLLIVLYLVGQDTSWSQWMITGQTSAGFANGESGASQYAVSEGRGTFVWRGDLFVDGVLSDNFSFLSNFRLLQDQELRVDLFALRISDIGSTGINVQIGQIDLPVGSLAERRFPKQNAFYRLPLMNEHLTTLCSSDYQLWVLVPSFAIRGDGVRILDQGLYDLGLKIYGSHGIFDYAVALINGMVSATGTYGESGFNNNDGFGTIVRIAVNPTAGLELGVSYGGGPFMNDLSSDTASFLFGRDPDDYTQHVIGGDLDFAIGHFSFYGQGVYNIWRYERDLKAFGYSLEARYAITPRISFAGRGGGLTFSEITGLTVPTFSGPVSYLGKWDRDVFRLETSVQYRMSREALLKIVYEWNRTFDSANDPADNLLVLQIVYSF